MVKVLYSGMLGVSIRVFVNASVDVPQAIKIKEPKISNAESKVLNIARKYSYVTALGSFQPLTAPKFRIYFSKFFIANKGTWSKGW